MKFPLIFYRRKTFSIERIADVVIKALYPDKSSHIRDILDKKRIYFNTHDLSSLHQYLEVAGHIVQLDKEEAPKHGQNPSTSSFSEIPEKDRALENFQDMMDPDVVSFYKVVLTNEGKGYYKKGQKHAINEIRPKREKIKEYLIAGAIGSLFTLLVQYMFKNYL